MTLPEGSRTVPSTVPKVDCALDTPLDESTQISAAMTLNPNRAMRPLLRE